MQIYFAKLLDIVCDVKHLLPDILISYFIDNLSKTFAAKMLCIIYACKV